MAVLVIPTSQSAEDSLYSQRISLTGRDYIFRFFFNTREEKWYMDLYDENEDLILAGRKITLNLDLLYGLTDPRKPDGYLMALDTTESEIDPGLTDMSGRVQLLFIPSEDLP